MDLNVFMAIVLKWDPWSRRRRDLYWIEKWIDRIVCRTPDRSVVCVWRMFIVLHSSLCTFYAFLVYHVANVFYVLFGFVCFCVIPFCALHRVASRIFVERLLFLLLVFLLLSPFSCGHLLNEKLFRLSASRNRNKKCAKVLPVYRICFSFIFLSHRAIVGEWIIMATARLWNTRESLANDTILEIANTKNVCASCMSGRAVPQNKR